MESGAGGGIIYLRSSPSQRIVNQELQHSCAPACGRQLLRDERIEVSEATIRAAAEFGAFGMSADALADALNVVQSVHRFVGGGIDPADLEKVAARGSFAARLKPRYSPAHMVIVDEILRGDHIVRVRDPWGNAGPGSSMGVEGELSLDTFLELWTLGIHNVVWRTG